MATTEGPPRDAIDIVDVMAALGNRRRLEIVAALADGQERTCGTLRGETPKSTMTHHWRTLRDAGVIWQRPHGREHMLRLRREDLQARFPGLLDAIL